MLHAPGSAPRQRRPCWRLSHAQTDSRHEFKKFYASTRERGFVLYPGKLTQMETFRVGCIGAIGPNEMAQAVHAVALTLQDMGITSAPPAH